MKIGTRLLAAALAAGLWMGTAEALSRPVRIEAQGSFFAGGIIERAPGAWRYEAPLDSAGQTRHGDHAYAFYQRPVGAKRLSMVFLHGAGQSGKTWETTPDGRDGFQNIFLSRGYGVYLVDQPRRGRAGRAAVSGAIEARTDEAFWFSNFRLGRWPAFSDGAAFPRDEAAMDQFYRQMTPDTGAYDAETAAAALAAVMERAGDGVLVTHSQGGGPGWRAAMRSERIRAIVSLEPGSDFVFPEGEAPAPLETSSPFGALAASEVPPTDFMKLTKIPIVIYYGDYIAPSRTEDWSRDSWRVRLEMARLWAETVNRHGGDATVVHLPEIGIRGNTHFLMADLNNETIADLMEAWMAEKGLAE